MNTLEIKNDLLRLMFETNDEILLNKVRQYFKLLRKEPISKTDLEKQELAMIEKGLEQFDKGQVISNEEARRRINKMLGINRSFIR